MVYCYIYARARKTEIARTLIVINLSYFTGIFEKVGRKLVFFGVLHRLAAGWKIGDHKNHEQAARATRRTAGISTDLGPTARHNQPGILSLVSVSQPAQKSREIHFRQLYKIGEIGKNAFVYRETYFPICA